MNRRQIFFACTAAFLLVTLAQAIPALSQDAPKRRPRIAVLDFDYGTVQTASAARLRHQRRRGKRHRRPAGHRTRQRRHLLHHRTQSSGQDSWPSRTSPTPIAPIRPALPRSASCSESMPSSKAASPNSATRPRRPTWAEAAAAGAASAWAASATPTPRPMWRITARIINIDTGEILAVADGTGSIRTLQHIDARRRRQLARLRRRQRRLRLQRLPADHHRRGHQGCSRSTDRRIWLRLPRRSASHRRSSRASSPPSTAVKSSSTSGSNAGIKVGDELEVLRVTQGDQRPRHRKRAPPSHHNRGHRQSDGRRRCLYDLHSSLRHRFQSRRPRQDCHPEPSPTSETPVAAPCSGRFCVTAER